jgi:hypothetical protein
VDRSTPRPLFTPRKDPGHIIQEAEWAIWPLWRGGKTRIHRDVIILYDRFYITDLTLYNPEITTFTTSISCNICRFWPQFINGIFIYLRMISDFCHFQNKLIGFYNIDLKPYNLVVSICTTNFTFKYFKSCPHCIYLF